MTSSKILCRVIVDLWEVWEKALRKKRGILKLCNGNLVLFTWEKRIRKNDLESDKTTKVDEDGLFLSCKSEGCSKLNGSEFKSSK